VFEFSYDWYFDLLFGLGFDLEVGWFEFGLFDFCWDNWWIF